MSEGTSGTDELARIGALVLELVEIAPWWSGTWSPLSEQSLEAFEATHSVTLPDDFRRLLLTIGDRAPIPGQARGGFLPLWQALELNTVGDVLGPLNEDFNNAGASEVSLAWDDERDDYLQRPPLRGLLPIGDGGCDVSYHLVVSGEERGRVWEFAASGAPELHATGLQLLTWYRERLDKGMEPLRNEAEEEHRLRQRVADKSSDMAAALGLGRRRLPIDSKGASLLIERSWQARDELSDDEQRECMRAVAELDLLHKRSERIAAMKLDDDPLLRCYAGIAAALEQRWADTELLLSEARPLPSAMQGLCRVYQGLAALHRGAYDQAIALLRAGPISAYAYHLLARAYTQSGQIEQARRALRRCLSGHERHPHWQPHKPTIAEQLMPALPSIQEIEEALASLPPSEGKDAS